MNRLLQIMQLLLLLPDEAETLKDRNMAAWRLSRLKVLPEDKQPGACIGCGNCRSHCPQAIDIPECMEEMAALL